MKVRVAGVAVLAVFALVGCGNAASGNTAALATPSTHVATRVPSPPNSEYEDAAALRDAAVAAGYSCDNWRTHENTLAASAGQCSPADAFATYKSAADTTSALHLVLSSDRDLGQGSVTQTYLVGPNWIIANLDGRQLKGLSRALGGHLRHA